MRNSAATELATSANLPAIPGGWAIREYPYAEKTLRLLQPANPDAFLDDEATHAAHETTGAMPYWAYLWPASLKMVAWISRQHWPAGTPVLELGAGIGQIGVAALLAGCEVTFSDYEPVAVDLCRVNAGLNGFPAAKGIVLDWRSPPALQFPVILGSEVTYEDQNHAPLLDVLQRVLSPSGRCWLGDAGRTRSEVFLSRALEAGFQFRLRDERGELLPGPRFGQFQLIELWREPVR